MTSDSVACPGRAPRPAVLASMVAQSVQALYMLLGLSLTAVGLASIVLPVIPTTTTLLASSFFLGRSLPGLQNRINAIPIIGTFIKYLDGTRIMTTRAQFGICAYLWVNLFLTCTCLYGIGLANYPIVSINIFCCVLSMIFVAKFHAERTIVTKAIPVGRASKANPSSDEIQLLAIAQCMSKEISDSLGGLPFRDSPAKDQLVTSD